MQLITGVLISLGLALGAVFIALGVIFAVVLVAS
jgi:hypothetical protein